MVEYFLLLADDGANRTGKREYAQNSRASTCRWKAEPDEGAYYLRRLGLWDLACAGGRICRSLWLHRLDVPDHLRAAGTTRSLRVK